MTSADCCTNRGGRVEPIDELEIPVNEEDFFRDPNDTVGTPAALRPFIGRLGAEILGQGVVLGHAGGQ